MPIVSKDPRSPRTDEWLVAQCRTILENGRELALTVGEINDRTELARAGTLGRKPRISEHQLHAVEASCKALHDLQVAIQNALFDTEYELRDLREREVSPAELLVEGEEIIRHYRFLRRRARIIDALLAYLPAVNALAQMCRDHLKRLHQGIELNELLVVPDCSFAAVALDQLDEEENRA
jgi:hypothetical protein